MRPNRSTGRREEGIALIIALMLLALLSVFSLGLYTMLTAETRTSGTDYYATQSFYAASAAIEKMTHDLLAVYAIKTQPTPADFNNISSDPPVIPGYTMSEYRIAFNGNSYVQNIPSGPYEGLVALVQPYRLLATATGISTKSETRMRRDFLNNLIPLFQFGIFYNNDLEVHAGPNFNFGGRVHTNGDLYVTAGSNTVFNSRVTVVGEVVRDVRKNGDSAGPPRFGGHVYILDNLNQQQELLMSGSGEGGSVIGGPSRPLTPSGSPNPSWVTYSPVKFTGNLINGATGALPLQLPIQLTGNNPVELIKRGKVGDPLLLKQSRFFFKPGLRISLSNTLDPVLVGGGCYFSTVLAPKCTTTSPVKPVAELTAKGYHFKVEIVPNTGPTIDVTQEFLNFGITAGSDANAIIRLQRPNVYGNTVPANLVVPISFFDRREGKITDDTTGLLGWSGLMTAMELDMNNLGRWLTGALAGSGNQVPNDNGYMIYTSDRRGEGPTSTNGEFDYEDTIFRNDKLDPGEDLNGNGVYDGQEKPIGPNGLLDIGVGSIANYLIKDSGNVVTFRRCLRLVNGTTLAAPITVATENPVYIQGNYNSITKQPAAVIGDAVTILSTGWLDQNSFNEAMGARTALPTTVQAAIMAGNTLSVYASPAPPYNEPHSSGGVHNLLRFLENWGGVTFTYTGSLVNLYTSRQGIGQWKCCTTVYSPPFRNWAFDTDFLNPALLPPATPHITTVQVQRVRQDLNPVLP